MHGAIDLDSQKSEYFLCNSTFFVNLLVFHILFVIT